MEYPIGWIIVMLILAIGVYFLPGIVAHIRNHHQENSFVLFNLFLGWTLLGWVIRWFGPQLPFESN